MTGPVAPSHVESVWDPGILPVVSLTEKLTCDATSGGKKKTTHQMKNS